MMRILVSLSAALVWLHLALGWPVPAGGSSGQRVRLATPDRDEILRIFKQAIALNEDFKSSKRVTSLEEDKRKRAALELYHEEELAPRVAVCVSLLSSGSDGQLAREFFNLLVSYENSADEELSFALGEIFLSNPEVVEKTVPQFAEPQQQLLYKRLEWGWINVADQRDSSDPRIEDRRRRLESLRSQMNKGE
jgi:hypothetical protein